MAEWNAREYNRQSSLQAALAEEHLSRLTLAGNERVLDVGCGDGKITAEIAALVPRGAVLGVDPSANMIAFATSHFGPVTHPNLRFEVADVRRLPYRHEFDRVISFNALHWVPDQGAALRSIRAALADTGEAFLRFVPQGPRKCIEDVVEDVRRSARWAAFFTNFQKPYIHLSPEAFQELASQNGFRVLQMRREDRAWDFQTREAFVAFSRATLVEWTRNLAESDWPAFINDVLDRYRSVAADNPHEASTFRFYQLEVVLAPA
jgi:trans-aconitate methyltransferase